LPAFAFLGRSNVGKSSVINLIAGSKIARISKTPGRTQTLNLYNVEEKWILGDFPGYGYAAVSKDLRKKWDQLLMNYLNARYFQFAVQIVDARHIGMDSDLALQDWLRKRSIGCLVVFNKSDKLNRKERADAERKARNVFSAQPLLFASTVTHEGEHELRKILDTMRSTAHLPHTT
jgi:GTP-binding protein